MNVEWISIDEASILPLFVKKYIFFNWILKIHKLIRQTLNIIT